MRDHKTNIGYLQEDHVNVLSKCCPHCMNILAFLWEIPRVLLNKASQGKKKDYSSLLNHGLFAESAHIKDNN